MKARAAVQCWQGKRGGKIIKPVGLPMFDATARDTWKRAARDEQREARRNTIMRAVLESTGEGSKRLELLERGARLHRILDAYLYPLAIALSFDLQESEAARE